MNSTPNIPAIVRHVRKTVRTWDIDRCTAFCVARITYKGGIGDPAIRELTGGFSSQSIDFSVMLEIRDRINVLKREAIARLAEVARG